MPTVIEVCIACFLIGVVAGSRAMLAPAAVSWAARLGFLKLSGTPMAFLGISWVPYIFTVLALGELVGDKLPQTPSRKMLFPFISRIISGAFAGSAIGAAADLLLPGLVVGAVGGAAGTLGGAAARARLAALFGKDLPAALLEDAVAITMAVILVTRA